MTRFRRHCAGLVLAVLATNGPVAFAQRPRPSVPWMPPGFGNDPAEMFEQMFGPTTPDEGQILDDIVVSQSEERGFGSQQVELYLTQLEQQQVGVLRTGKDVDYMRKLVAVIQPLMTNAQRYRRLVVYVVDSPAVDARSFPGGTLFFYRGLLDFAESEAAVVGIVGHELSHLDRGHLLLPLKRTRLWQQSPVPTQFAGDPQAMFANGAAMMRLMARPFRPEDESMADRDGTDWAYRAGYDPRELARLFTRLDEAKRDPRFPLAEFFRSHPFDQDRAVAIQQRYQQLTGDGARHDLYVGRRNLALRQSRAQRRFADR